MVVAIRSTTWLVLALLASWRALGHWEDKDMDTWDLIDAQQRLLDVSKEYSLPPDHRNYLWGLKQSGFEPKVIYDIGACCLHWTEVAREVWPKAKIILFDAYLPAQFMYKDYDHHMGPLCHVDHTEVRFYQNYMHPAGSSYYREMGSSDEAVALFSDERSVLLEARTLDSVVRERGFLPPDLIKMDVQGAERDIVTGGRETIAHAQRLIVEMQHQMYNLGAPHVTETLPLIESLGFKCTAPMFSNNGPDADYGFERVDKAKGVHAFVGQQ